MTKQELEQAIRLTGTNRDGEWHLVPEGKSLTFHVAASGVGLTVARVTGLLVGDPLVQLRTARDEVYLVGLQDIFAIAIDQGGTPTRKAGFITQIK